MNRIEELREIEGIEFRWGTDGDHAHGIAPSVIFVSVREVEEKLPSKPSIERIIRLATLLKEVIPFPHVVREEPYLAINRRAAGNGVVMAVSVMMEIWLDPGVSDLVFGEQTRSAFEEAGFHAGF